MTITISDLKFRSKKQENSVLNYLLKKRKDSTYRIHKQWDDGTITLHHFFKVDGDWLGYALSVGARGGERAYHKCFVYTDTDGILQLHHS